MKTMNTIKKETEPTFHGLNEEKIILIIKVAIIFFLIALNASVFMAQNSSDKIKPLFSSGIFSTGNGHGAFYSLNMGVIKGRNAISAGPVIQKCSMQARGLKVSYSRVLTVDTNYKHESGMKDLLQLNFFSSIQYTNKLQLSNSVLRDEKLIWGDNKQDLNQIRLSTGELILGFEFYVNITNQISWKNYAGASVYYHFNYTEQLDHQKIAPTLSLGTGICFFIQ
ncbi:MAG: hypothetical protein Q8L81_01835 [Bacteroidota bacterium]|nr:hypothetical protein [Bacteroidota bacterium]